MKLFIQLCIFMLFSCVFLASNNATAYNVLYPTSDIDTIDEGYSAGKIYLFDDHGQAILHLDRSSKESFWAIVGRFASTVGFKVLTNLVTDYITDYIKDWFDDEVEETNDKLTSQSKQNQTGKVYSQQGDGATNPISYREEAPKDKVFYPVYVEPEDTTEGSKVLLPVFDLANPDQKLTAILKGPEILGLTAASEDYSLLHSANEVRSLFLPTAFIQEAEGSIETGYSTPARFYTAVGEVEIQYQSFGSQSQMGKGEIRIIATHGNTTVFDTSYEVGFDR